MHAEHAKKVGVTVKVSRQMIKTDVGARAASREHDHEYVAGKCRTFKVGLAAEPGINLSLIHI